MTEDRPMPLLKRAERLGFPCMVLGLALLFIVLLNMTWMKWGDPVVDTGRELEIPCKIVEGKILYRDMAYNYGPFSPWVNACFVMAFGPRLISFVLSGIVSSLVGLLLVFLTSRVFLEKRLACCVAGLFLFECVFQHYYYNGNFCFILPYSFSAVHALLAALGAFLFLSRHLENKGGWPLAGAGLCVGICFLCKIEIAGAIAVPVAIVPMIMNLQSNRGMKRTFHDTLCWSGPLLIVAAGGFLPYFFHASMGTVLWENVLKPQLIDFRSNIFFMQHLGLSHLGYNLRLMGLSLLMWAVFLAALLTLANLCSGRKSSRISKGLAAICTAGIAIWLWIDLTWEIEFRCLPVVIIVVLAALLFSMLFRKGALTALQGKLLALALFAGLALMRIFLTAGTFHYGFCLALPGVILFAVVLMRFLPEQLPVRLRPSRFYAGMVASALLLLSAHSFLTASRDNFDSRTVPLEGPGGRMWVQAKPLGVDLYLTIEFLSETAKPGESLLVLPEGAFLNFITALPNPTYYNLFIPPELNADTEKKVIAQIKATAVDWIVLLNRPVGEFGSRGLGVDYGLELMAYVDTFYQKVASFGPKPYSGPDQGGCILFKLRSKEG
ncbi:MAG: hypothetical protein ABIK28_15210 [Planctomycetota bacterium]